MSIPLVTDGRACASFSECARILGACRTPDAVRSDFAKRICERVSVIRETRAAGANTAMCASLAEQILVDSDRPGALKIARLAHEIVTTALAVRGSTVTTEIATLTYVFEDQLHPYEVFALACTQEETLCS